MRKPAGFSKPGSNGLAAPKGGQDEAPKEAAAPAVEPKAPPLPAIPRPADLSPNATWWDQTPREGQEWYNQRALQLRQHLATKQREIDERAGKYKAYDEALSEDDQKRLLRNGQSAADILRRSVAWDRDLDRSVAAPLRNQAALDWLGSYGFDLNELYEFAQNGGAQVQQQAAQQGVYLTREEAEKIADERVAKVLSEREQQSHVDATFKLASSFLQSQPLAQDPRAAVLLETAMVEEIPALLQENPLLAGQQLLEKALEKVMTSHPVFSAYKAHSERAKQAESDNAAAERALQASRSISGGPGSGTPTKKYKNFEENLRANMRK